MSEAQIQPNSANGQPAAFRSLLNTALFDLRSPLGRLTNIIGMGVIVFSVLLAMVATLDVFSARTKRVIELIELTVTVLFAFEYFLRVWAAKYSWRYIFSFYGLVDLMTWLPLLLLGDANLAIRLLRILRLLKLLRYLRALELFLRSLSDVLDVLLVLVIAIVITVLISGNLVYFLEPNTFDNAFSGAWWALVTMTTVGYGDMVPVTVAGKVVAALLMVIGISMFALLTGTISVKVAHLLTRDRDCQNCNRAINSDYQYCPRCGAEQIPSD